MPTVFRSGPYRFFFYSNEGSESVHIHIEAGGKTAKYWVNVIEHERSEGFRAHDLAEIRRIIEENQELIRQKWNEHFGITQKDGEGN